MIMNIGKDIGKRYSIRFYVEDFRIGWNEGVNLSKNIGLYRQKYCGCIYSEEEKYTKNQKK
jgi:predicted adenine nucleotide alpha hydrolase (AANH) superfamily ATPase